MKTALVSFLHPKARPYWPDALQSINLQTDVSFDTIVVNDAFGTIDANGVTRIINNEAHFSSLALRQHVFNLLMDDGYDLLISLDADDTMSADRVSNTIKACEEHPEAAFYYSALNYMAEPERAFFDLPEYLNDIKMIFFSNYIGLSHMSLNLKFLRKNSKHFNFPQNVIALDWYLAVSMLLAGFSGKKTQGTTYYRLYGDNLAGEMSDATFEKAVRVLKIKVSHYEAIESLLEDRKYKEACASELVRLRSLLNSSEEELRNYLHSRKPVTTNHWWAEY